MPKAMKKRPGSLRLGAAEIEAAELLGKPVEHLVAREARPQVAAATPPAPAVTPESMRMLEAAEAHHALATAPTDAEIDHRAERLFALDRDELVDALGLVQPLHVGGGCQDVADATPPVGLRLSDDERGTISDEFWETDWQDVDVSSHVRAGVIRILKSAPSTATVGELLTLVEALS